MNNIQQLGQYLLENNLSISSGESITGGLFASQLTNISGISKVFRGSIVAYQNEIKINVIGVSADTINNSGAISKQCAYEMLVNVKRIFKSDIAVSFTGNAGPNPSENKAVGLVYIGISMNNQDKVYELNFKGERTQIRQQCIDFVCEKILNENK